MGPTAGAADFVRAAGIFLSALYELKFLLSDQTFKVKVKLKL